MSTRTTRQLVLKCSLDNRNKKITFESAQNCTYDILKRRVEQCFALSASSFSISYKDDDGEITPITSETDLTEAIQYFQAGDDPPLSSAASILSGRSFGSRKVTIKLQITVEYDGPSLSDTSSLISLEEYQGRNGSQRSFSFVAPATEDDSITVSSRDNSGTSSRFTSPKQGTGSTSTSRFTMVSRPSGGAGGTAIIENRPHDSSDPFSDVHERSSNHRFPDDPSAVFERLKLQERLGDDLSSVHSDFLVRDDRGAAWLRDQNERTIRSKLGALPEPSVSDDYSLIQHNDEEEALSGDLALERNPSGRYYYTYTSAGSSASQSHESGDDDGPSRTVPIPQRTRPSSMHQNWLAAHQVKLQDAHAPQTSLSVPSLHTLNPDPFSGENLSPTKIDKELLKFLPPTVPPEESLTDCSICGTLLDTIRYVCSTCGEKYPRMNNPLVKGKERANSLSFVYPPQSPYIQSLSSSQANSLSSQTYVGGSSETLTSRYMGNPSSPNLAIPGVPSSNGFELCSGCLESAGIHHAIEAGRTSRSSSTLSPSVNGDTQAASQWRRAAPRKGELRHAFLEKSWCHTSWEDVAGLPGNLDSEDGGHNSSHILIKIPYPLEITELESASKRAINLWTGRDAASVGLTASRSKPGSVVSSYARTVVGNASRHALAVPTDDHHLHCNECNVSIVGVRYQSGFKA
ncbi:hypothetical protein H0H92_000945 [Tricholoma furcatifolium]|nr:hypothetical protein H0H92_000945 [Tricholoma furcatifolium]